MTGREWAEVYQDQIDALTKLYPMTLDGLVDALSHEGSPAGSQACRVFAVVREWPPLESHVAHEVVARLTVARDLLSQPHLLDSPDELHELESINSVLIEYYEDVGRRFWLVRRLKLD